METKAVRRTEGPYGEICTYWLARRCARNPCRFLHIKSPTTFHYGRQSHSFAKKTPKYSSNKKSGGDVTSSSKTNQKSSQSIYRYWMNGNCTHSDKCRNLHSWFCGEGFSMLANLHEHKKIVTGLALPVGSDKLFSGSTMEQFRCGTARQAWNIQTSAKLNLDGPKGQAFAMVAGNDTLFAGAKDGVIYAWEGSFETTSSFEPLATLNGHTSAVICLTVGRNVLYSGSMDGSIKAWDITTLQCAMTLNAHTNVVTSLVCWDEYLLSSSLDGTVKVWAATEAGILEVIYTHNEEHGVLALGGMTDPEGKHILICSRNDGSVGPYELSSFSERGRLFSKQGVRTIEVAPGGLFFMGYAFSLLTVWKWSELKQKMAS